MSRNIVVKRIYDAPERVDGRRVLVDRLWPRGVTKTAAKIDDWAKEIAPPRELVAWFHEDKAGRFAEFKKKYRTYLKKQESFGQNITDQKGKVTLLTAVKDIEHSHLPTLLQFLSK